MDQHLKYIRRPCFSYYAGEILQLRALESLNPDMRCDYSIRANQLADLMYQSSRKALKVPAHLNSQFNSMSNPIQTLDQKRIIDDFDTYLDELKRMMPLNFEKGKTWPVLPPKRDYSSDQLKYNLKQCMKCGQWYRKGWKDHFNMYHDGITPGKLPLFGTPTDPTFDKKEVLRLRRIARGQCSQSVANFPNECLYNADPSFQQEDGDFSQISGTSTCFPHKLNAMISKDEETEQQYENLSRNPITPLLAPTNVNTGGFQQTQNIHNSGMLVTSIGPQSNPFLQFSQLDGYGQFNTNTGADESSIGANLTCQSGNQSEVLSCVASVFKEFTAKLNQTQSLFQYSNQANRPSTDTFAEPAAKKQIIAVQEDVCQAMKFLRQLQETSGDDSWSSWKMQLSCFGHHFLSQNVRDYLKSDIKHTRLKSLLTQWSPKGNLDSDAGLFNAMIILGEVDDFAQKLGETQDNVQEILDKIGSHGDLSHLSEVSRWLSENWKFYTPNHHTTVKRLNEQKSTEPSFVYLALQIQRVIRTSPSDLIHVRFAAQVNGFTDLLQSHLKIHREQPHISFQEFEEILMVLDKHSVRAKLQPFENEMINLAIDQWLDFIQSKTNQYKLAQNDQKTIEDCIAEMEGRFKMQITANVKNKIKSITEGKGLILDKLRKFPNMPSNAQLAVAIFSIGLSLKQDQIWAMPQGSGKSYVIAVLSLLILEWQKKSKVHILLPSNHLRMREEAEFANVWGGFGRGDGPSVKYYDKIENVHPDSEDYFIVDEADLFVYNHTDALFSVANQAKRTICFTATMGDSLAFLEKNIFKPAKMAVFNYMPAYIPLTIDAELKGSDNSAICKYLIAEMQKKPVLIYCTKELHKAMEDHRMSPWCVDNCTDFQALRNLSKRRTDGTYQLLTAMEALTMRGTDFRANAIGICLVIQKQLNNQREVDQALGRCGRHGEPAKRLRTESIRLLYDPVTNQAEDDGVMNYYSLKNAPKVPRKRDKKKNQKDDNQTSKQVAKQKVSLITQKNDKNTSGKTRQNKQKH